MGGFSRRGFLRSTGAGAAAVATTGAAAAPAEAARARATVCVPEPPVTTVAAADPRYGELVSRGFNARFVGAPDLVHVVHTPKQIDQVVTDAVAAGKRIAVRSGGHCFENFADHRDVRVLIDTSPMRAVYFDKEHRAFAVQPAATLGEVYRTLFYDYGVTLPAGVCPQVGAGGHVAGGGYGPLTRRDGTVVDHLYGVEVVVVDASGKARTLTATRERDDPHHDLWWAHTGGGGGNFGIVTRYLFRTPGASGDDPSALLPKPPTRLRSTFVTWSWADLDLAKFTRIVTNFSRWYEQNHTDARYGSLYSTLHLNTRDRLHLPGHPLRRRPRGRRRTDRAVCHRRQRGDRPGAGRRAHRRPLAPGHPRRALRHRRVRPAQVEERLPQARLDTRAHQDRPQAPDRPRVRGLGRRRPLLVRGKVNTVAPGATAVPQRDSILKAWFSATWMDPGLDDVHLNWIRELYRDVFRDTGGVPVPNDDHDGCYINYPDTDLADPRWNTSDVPWHTLYYKDGYRRLQKVKAKYDPRGVFQHPLSVRLP